MTTNKRQDRCDGDQSEDRTRDSLIRYQEVMRTIGGVGAQDEGTAVNEHNHLKCDTFANRHRKLDVTGSSFLGLRSGVKTARLRQSSVPRTEVAASAPVTVLRMEAGRDTPGWGHDLRSELNVCLRS